MSKLGKTVSKTVRIGAIWMNEVETKDGRKSVPSIRLGASMKKNHPKYNADYDISVELVAKDGNGKVVAHLTSDEIKAAFINLYEPKEGAPDSLKYELVVARK